MPLERLTLLVVRPGAAPVIVVPRLERAAAEAGLRTAVDILTWGETDDPYALATAGLPASGRIALSDTMLAMHVLRLQAAQWRRPQPSALRVLETVACIVVTVLVFGRVFWFNPGLPTAFGVLLPSMWI